MIQQKPNPAVAATIAEYFDGKDTNSLSDVQCLLVCRIFQIPTIDQLDRVDSVQGVEAWVAWSDHQNLVEINKVDGSIFSYEDAVSTSLVKAAFNDAIDHHLKPTKIIIAESLHVRALLAQDDKNDTKAMIIGNNFRPFKNGEWYSLSSFHEKLMQLSAEIASATPNGPSP